MEKETARKRAKVMLAYADGEEIEFFNKMTGKWQDVTAEAMFDSTVEYRVKSKPAYRPFATLSECWHEMHSHPDFGWLKSKHSDSFAAIAYLTQRMGDVRIAFSFSESPEYKMYQVFDDYVFTDNTPFGIKK